MGAIEHPIAFETWTFRGTRFLAVPVARNVAVCDEAGQNFGAWYSVQDFRERQRKGDPLVYPVGGRVQVSFTTHALCETAPSRIEALEKEANEKGRS
jgi:hypothetical protein